MYEYIILGVLGYLIGSISVPRLIFFLKRPGIPPEPIISYSKDGRAQIIAHQVGSTNVLLAFGKRWGLASTALDIAKSFIPVLVTRLSNPDTSLHLIVAGTIFLGVLWPVWHRFQGGGGNSCILGIILAISPLGLIATHAGGALISRRFPRYTFIAGVILTVPWFAFRFGLFSGEVLLGIFLSIAYIVAQIPEALQLSRFEKEGHVFEMDQVINMMRHPEGRGKPIEEDVSDEL